ADQGVADGRGAGRHDGARREVGTAQGADDDRGHQKREGRDEDPQDGGGAGKGGVRHGGGRGAETGGGEKKERAGGSSQSAPALAAFRPTVLRIPGGCRPP